MLYSIILYAIIISVVYYTAPGRPAARTHASARRAEACCCTRTPTLRSSRSPTSSCLPAASGGVASAALSRPKGRLGRVVPKGFSPDDSQSDMILIPKESKRANDSQSSATTDDSGESNRSSLIQKNVDNMLLCF